MTSAKHRTAAEPGSCASLFRLSSSGPHVNMVAEQLHVGRIDPHWAPQSDFCGGLTHSLAFYNSVVSFSRLQQDFPAALRRHGVPADAVERVERVMNTSWMHGGQQHVFSGVTQGEVQHQLSEASCQKLVRFYSDDYTLLARSGIEASLPNCSSASASLPSRSLHPPSKAPSKRHKQVGGGSGGGVGGERDGGAGSGVRAATWAAAARAAEGEAAREAARAAARAAARDGATAARADGTRMAKTSGDGIVHHRIQSQSRMASMTSRYSLVACTVLKNEARWLPEWLEYHAMPQVGFQHFFLYDDASTDSLAPSVEPYVRRGLVTLLANFTGSAAYLGNKATFYEGPGTVGKFLPQAGMVSHCISQYGPVASWVAFIDVDEYIVPRHDTPPPEQLRRVNGSVGLVRLVGESPLAERQPVEGELVIKLGVGTSVAFSEALLRDQLNNSFPEYHRQKCILRPEAFSHARWEATDSIRNRGTIHSLPLKKPYRLLHGGNTAMYLVHFQNLKVRNASEYYNLLRDAQGHTDKLIQVAERERERVLARAHPNDGN